MFCTKTHEFFIILQILNVDYKYDMGIKETLVIILIKGCDKIVH